MDQETLEELQENLKIAKDRIIQEEYEVLVLRGLLEAEFGGKLVLKGGTALRLAYDSPRFSDDLDFSVLGKISPESFLKTVEKIANRHLNTTLTDARKKYYTIFALFRIVDPLLKLPFSIKVEISTRKVAWEKGKDYELTNLKSPASNIIVLGNTATLDRLKKDKLQAFRERREPKDLYDIWFITAKLEEEFKLPSHRLSKRSIKQGLNKYLPKDEQYVLNFLTGEK